MIKQTSNVLERISQEFLLAISVVAEVRVATRGKGRFGWRQFSANL
jgi:hypothetical protein